MSPSPATARLIAAAIVVGTVPLATAAVGADRDRAVELVVTGQLESVVHDDFEQHTARTETTLVLRDGTRLDVRRTPDLPTTGQVTATVAVEDAATDADRLSTRSAEGLDLAHTLEAEPVTLHDPQFAAADTLATTSAPHQVYVAVVRNHGDWGTTTTQTLQSRVAEVLGGWELEGGAQLPAFDVAGWQDFTANGCGLGGDFWQVTAEAKAELYPTVDFRLEPNHLVVLVPDECETGSVGTASVGSSLASGGVSVNSLENTYGPPTLAHELGHNFGLGHSAAEFCDLDGFCYLDSYRDFYDVMGGATRGSVPVLNSPHRDDLQLLAGTEVSTLELPATQTTTSRTATLRPRSDASGLRTLRLVDPETLEPWYVEYRSGTGRDATAGYRAWPTYPPGVLVLSGEGRESTLWKQPGEDSPQSWSQGTTFTNESGTATVTVNAIEPGVSATVTATITSDAPFVAAPPSVVVTGTARVDTYLEFDPSGWPEDADLTYTWLLDGQPYPGAYDRLYVSGDMRGSTLQLEVSASVPGHRGVVRLSAVLGPVTRPVTGSVQLHAEPLRVKQPVHSSVTTLPSDAQRAYQWYVDDVPVPGATASSYTPTVADEGGMLTLVVTASRTGWDPGSLVSAPLGPVPTSLVAGIPTVAGTPTVGSRLTADPGTWPDDPELSFQWLRNGFAIPDADQPSYDLVAADLGKQVAVRVRGTKSGFDPASATSVAVTVAPGTLVAGTPIVAGTPKVGRRLTADPGAWTGGATLRYQWLANGAAIRGATSPRLLLPKAVRGKRISVRVTGTKPGYTRAVTTSAATAAVRR